VSSRNAGTGAAGFAPARASRVASGLGGDDIHLWWFGHDRHRGRAPLKALLAAYLDVEPDALSLVDDAHGRPHLAGRHGLHFNWSHSGSHAMVAVARALPALGVDIEQRRARPRVLELARRFFAEREHAALQQLPPIDRNDAFLRLWTAKEAVLKAHGRGLAYGLERVEFAVGDGAVRPLRFRGEVGGPDQWQCVALAPDAAVVGTLAWRGPPRRICRFSPMDGDFAGA